MSSKADALIRKAEQGERVRAIRDTLGVNGDAFAARLNDAAKRFGIPGGYDKFKVSRMESGSRKLSAEEVAMLVEIDPRKRTPGWVLFGETAPAQPKRVTQERQRTELKRPTTQPAAKKTGS